MVSSYDYLHSSIDTRLNLDRYYAAKELLSSLLQGTHPDKEVLSKIYGGQLVDLMYKNFYNYVNSDLFFKGDIRLHEPNPPKEISECRERILLDSYSAGIESDLHSAKSPIPSIERLEPAFGRFSSYVHENYKLLKEPSLKRKGTVYYVVHPNSVAFTVKELFTPKTPNSSVDMDNILISTTAGALHDSPEELVTDLSNYDRFMSTMIPRELQEPVRVLTNHYDMILESAKEYFFQRQASPNKKMLIKYLSRSGAQYKSLSYYTDRLAQFINETDSLYNNSKGGLLKDLKKPVYDNLYIIDFWDMSQKLNNYSHNEIKIIDLSDNSEAINHLNYESRGDSATKRQIFCDTGFSKDNLPPHVKIHLRELQDDALTDAETIVLQEIMYGRQYNFSSAVNALVKLYPVFFTNYPQK